MLAKHKINKENTLKKQAGNSITVNVLVEIYKEIFNKYPNEFNDLKVVSLFSGIGAFEKAFEKLKLYIK